MAIYVNRTYDSVAGAFVRWNTSAPDVLGTSYPGPGIFGGTATDYCVEDIDKTTTVLVDFRNDFITGETVTGTDSILTQTLTATPSDPESVLILYNRQGLTQGQDYTIVGQAIVWLASSGTAPNLIPSDTLFIYYVVDSLAASIDFINDLITGETVTGTDSALSGTLSNSPSDPESIICVYNRQILTQGQDYSVSGTTITWLASSGTAPNLIPSDTLQFYYVINTAPGGGGSTDFVGLTDTPANYTGHSLKTVRVNVGETGLEFVVATSGSSLTVTTQKIANYNAVVSELVPYDPSGGTFTITLPTGGSDGDTIVTKNDTTDVTGITVDTAGAETIDGAATYTLNLSKQSVTFVYDGTSAWRVI